MDLEQLLEERVPHLAEKRTQILNSIRACAQNASAIYSDPDLNDKARSRRAKEQLRVALDGARQTFGRERANASRTLANLSEERARLRLPEAPANQGDIFARELRTMRIQAELRSMAPEQRSRLLRQSAASGDRTILDAVTASIDNVGLDYNHIVEPAWSSWQRTREENGALEKSIEETQQVAQAIDVMMGVVETEARNVVRDATRDPTRPNANEGIMQAFEDALKDIKQEAAREISREAFFQKHGKYPEETAPDGKSNIADAEKADADSNTEVES